MIFIQKKVEDTVFLRFSNCWQAGGNCQGSLWSITTPNVVKWPERDLGELIQGENRHTTQAKLMWEFYGDKGVRGWGRRKRNTESE